MHPLSRSRPVERNVKTLCLAVLLAGCTKGTGATSFAEERHVRAEMFVGCDANDWARLEALACSKDDIAAGHTKCQGLTRSYAEELDDMLNWAYGSPDLRLDSHHLRRMKRDEARERLRRCHRSYLEYCKNDCFKAEKDPPAEGKPAEGKPAEGKPAK